MGVPKAELALDGERLVDRAVRVLTDGGCDDVVAVIRPGVGVPGARALLRARPELVDEIEVTGDPQDLDTPADLQSWRDSG